MEQSYTAPTAPCPPELIGVAALFEGLTPAQRAAAASAIYGTLAGMLALAKRSEPDLPALNENEQSALDYIREHGPVSAKQIAEHVCVEEQTVRTWTSKSGRLYAAGVRHKPFLGYFLADVD